MQRNPFPGRSFAHGILVPPTVNRFPLLAGALAAFLVAPSVGWPDDSGARRQTTMDATSSVGLVAAYSLDDAQGTSVSDASGKGNDGIISGATWNMNGRFGASLSFDGVNDWITIADADSLDLTAAMTFEAWIYPTTELSGWHTVLLKERSSGLAYGLYASSDLSLPAVCINIDTDRCPRGGTQLPANQWTHLAATYDNANLRLYVNGNQVASEYLSGSATTSSGVLRIGGNAVWSDEFFRGLIDEVRIYDRALSAAEIQADMTTPVGSLPPDTTPPTASLASIPQGPTFTAAQTVTLAVDATDDVGVTRVELYDGATLMGTDTNAPFSYEWPISSTDNGTHNWTARAYDAAGNVATSNGLALTVAVVPADGSITLQWDPVLDEPLVTGYQVHFGLASGDYEWFVEANENGAATDTKTVEDLEPGTTYFFAVRSRNHDIDLVSTFSNEVSATVETTPVNRPPSLTNPGEQSGTLGDLVSLQILASDPDGDALTFSVAGLPPGLGIDSGTGLIGGTLGTIGSYQVTVTVSDGTEQAQAGFGWVVAVANHPPIIANPSQQSGTVGDAVALQILASDPDGDALTYSATGLPPGLGIDASSGLVSGTLTDAGNFGVTATVADGSEQAQTSFGWTVAAANRPPVVTNPGDQHGLQGDVVSLAIPATDPDGDALVYSAVGLPPGLGIDAQSGLVTGTLEQAGNYQVTATVSDGVDEADADFAWHVDAPQGIPAEAGLVLGVTNTDWTSVILEHSYDSMVVVATPRYDPSAPPQIVRVRNAAANAFEVRMARVDGGTATVSTAVHYLVVEEGIYDAATDGVTMEAVKYTSTVTDAKGSWTGEEQIYANDYVKPVVIGQVMSANDPLPSSFWARGGWPSNPPNAFTLYTGKTVAEDPVQTRADELVGYIVIEEGTGILGDRPFVAGVGTDSVGGMDNAPPYEYPIDDLYFAEVALLGMAGIDGADGGWPVLVEDLDPARGAIGIAVDEDQLNDSERSHTTEQIAYLVLDYALVEGNRPPLVTNPPDFGAVTGTTLSLQIDAVDPDGDELAFFATGLPLGLSIDPATGLIEGTIAQGEGGIYEVLVSVDDGKSSADVLFSLAVAAPADGARAWIGVIEGVSSGAWSEVVLPEIYASMVVVTTPAYTKDDPPAVVRIRDAFADRFEVRLARLDGGVDAITADVHYLVVEEGVYTPADAGVMLEAVKYESTVTDRAGSWGGEARTYANSYANPVVLGQVMSANDPAPSTFWCNGSSTTAPPSATSLSTGKTVNEDPNQYREHETIGYLVLEAGLGTLDELSFEAAIGADSIKGLDAGPHSYALSSRLGSVSVALGTIAGMDGDNGGWAVVDASQDPNPESLTLGVDEDQLKDSERSHTSEQVGYIVFE